jgi:superfamily I DNA/RNA helicase/mRNA-degrading endonuclease RelE of RelBE toxin-antitoxin system
MDYVIAQKDKFQRDFMKLNGDLQERVHRAISELEDNPNTIRGDTVKPLKGYKDLWRYRIGDFRLIYAVFQKLQLVQLLGVGPRGEIYKRFRFTPDEPEFINYSQLLEDTLNPGIPTPSEWESFTRPVRNARQNSELPYLLTRNQLEDWNIPQENHHFFVSCRSEDELLNCGGPDEYISYIVECMWPTTMEDVAQQPNWLLQSPDDLIRYADGDLIGFLLLLDREQDEYVNWAMDGPTLVKGGPGSGKSTVALYRIRKLVEQSSMRGNQQPEILFITYTNALVKASEQQLNRLLTDFPARVRTATLDKIAMEIVRKKDGNWEMANSREIDTAIAKAKASFSSPINNIREEYLADEILWVIEGQSLNSLDEYINKANRVGRGRAFSPTMREAMWRIYQDVKHQLNSNGKHTWGELRTQATNLLKKGFLGKKWDYVVIDEAQDLTPMALSLAVELCKDSRGVFLTADASQSIYNRGFAWINVHDSLRLKGRTRILLRNYRTTRQIAEAANNMIESTGAGDEEILKQFYVHVGPKPTIYASNYETEGLKWMVGEIKIACRELRLPPKSVAVLVKTKDLGERVSSQLTSLGLLTHYVEGRNLDLEQPGAKVLTIHSAKGLEFPIVALPYFEEGIFPWTADGSATPDEIQIHENHEMRLVYVAWTRAMRRLFVTYRQGHASPFRILLDDSYWRIITSKTALGQ